jgi:hypothetical protein
MFKLQKLIFSVVANKYQKGQTAILLRKGFVRDIRVYLKGEGEGEIENIVKQMSYLLIFLQKWF